MFLKSLTFLVLCCLTLAGQAQTIHVDSKDNIIAIAVSTDFLLPLKALQKEFEEQTPYKLKISSASTGKLYAQILYGTRYHIFLAADSSRPALLEKHARAVKGSRFTYAIGQLVLYSNNKNIRESDFKSVLKQTDTFHRLAIANPKSSPYGLAAQQVLESLSLWGPLRAKIISGKNIAQAYRFILNKQAEIGLLARSQIKGKVWAIPSTLYEPIIQEAVLLQNAKDHQPAQDFLNYLKSAQAQAIILKYGYSLPGSRSEHKTDSR